jgi:hypothetical protein
MLGEHFSISHNNYEDFSVLDNNMKQNTSFPSFEVLEHIDMINTYNVKFNKGQDRCSICLHIFKDKEEHYDINNNIKYDDIEYYSDTECDYRNYDYHILKDDNLIECYNRCSDIIRLPIQMSCCNQLICPECLELHVSITNSLTCPFCKKDHTKHNEDYIIIVEPIDDIDNSKWFSWWVQHLDIFY